MRSSSATYYEITIFDIISHLSSRFEDFGGDVVRNSFVANNVFQDCSNIVYILKGQNIAISGQPKNPYFVISSTFSGPTMSESSSINVWRIAMTMFL